MTTVVRPGGITPVLEAANDLQLRALVTSESTADVSVTWVQLAGHHRRLRTDRSTRVYAVLAGAIDVQVGDDPAVTVAAGELVVIPRGRPYELNGVGTYLVVNAPAFVEGDDVYLDAGSVRDAPSAEAGR